MGYGCYQKVLHFSPLCYHLVHILTVEDFHSNTYRCASGAYEQSLLLRARYTICYRVRPWTLNEETVMDPNATLRQIDEFLSRHRTGDEVDLWCEILFDWLERGGFAPAWSAHPLGESYYRCREIHIRRGERIA